MPDDAFAPYERAQINIRLPLNEIKEIAEKASSLGLSRNSYIRMLLNLPLEITNYLTSDERNVLTVNANEIPRLVREYFHSGSKLEQMANVMNKIGIYLEKTDHAVPSDELFDVCKRLALDMASVKESNEKIYRAFGELMDRCIFVVPKKLCLL